jgi:hypothetical protein
MRNTRENEKTIDSLLQFCNNDEFICTYTYFQVSVLWDECPKLDVLQLIVVYFLWKGAKASV